MTVHPFEWINYSVKAPPKWTMADAMIEGFKPKTADHVWSEKDEVALKEIFNSLKLKETHIHTLDPYHWVSHHGFDGHISKKAVRKKINEIIYGSTQSDINGF